MGVHVCAIYNIKFKLPAKICIYAAGHHKSRFEDFEKLSNIF